MVRKVNGVRITDVEWDEMVDEQPQNSWVVDAFNGSDLSGTDGTSGRVATLTNSVNTMLFVTVSGQMIKPSQFSASGTSLTINVIVDDTSPVIAGYLKSV